MEIYKQSTDRRVALDLPDIRLLRFQGEPGCLRETLLYPEKPADELDGTIILMATYSALSSTERKGQNTGIRLQLTFISIIPHSREKARLEKLITPYKSVKPCARKG